jgi:hypothetical protein
MNKHLSYRDLPALLKSKELTDGEKSYLEYYFGQTSSFTQKLMEAITAADWENISRLAKGFPGEVAAYIAWTEGSLHSRCVAIITHEIMGAIRES